VCSEECEMCYGGWPQDAFEYVMENSGVPLSSDIPYDGDTLLELSQAMTGESDEMKYVDNCFVLCEASSQI